jgi:Esterase/lipase
MDWILLALAAFNTFSMITIYRDRHSKRLVPPWTQFAYSLITTELAWFWLPSQVLVAGLLVAGGAMESSLGGLAMAVLVMSWIPLAISIKNAFAAGRLTREALSKGLGKGFLSEIPHRSREKISFKSQFKDWYLPFKMKKPDVEVLKDIPYGPLGMNHFLDIFRPATLPPEGCPVVLHIHGGGWVMGSKDQEALPLKYYLAERGWICVSINYRLSPSVPFPTHLEDCKAALAWIRQNGQDYGMDTSFVGVTGGSAGGHLTALMGLTQQLPELQKGFEEADTSVQAVVPFYGVYDLAGLMDRNNREFMVNYIHHRVIFDSPEENPEVWRLGSPCAHVNEDLPPFMVIQGEIDSLTTVTGARLFSLKLQETSKNPSVYLELPGAEHAFDLIHSPRTEPVIAGVYCFMEWCLARQRANLESPEVRAI